MPKALDRALRAAPKYRAQLPDFCADARSSKSARCARGVEVPQPTVKECSGRSRTPRGDGAGADPLADERRMYDGILGGAGRPRGGGRPLQGPRRGSALTAAPMRTGRGRGAGEDASLLAVLTTRLAEVEKKCAERTAALGASQQRAETLAAENAELRRLLEQLPPGDGGQQRASADVIGAAVQECRALREQIHEMETFLAEYGLVWVGKGSASRPRAARFLADGRPRALPDVVAALRRLEARSAAAAEGGVAGAVVPLAVFADGLLLFRGPFRPWRAASCRRLIDDALDGYFPSEFRERFPGGAPLQVADHSHERYADLRQEAGGGAVHTMASLKRQADAAAPMQKHRFLSRLPGRAIAPSGTVLDIRGDLEQRLAPQRFRAAGAGQRLGGDADAADGADGGADGDDSDSGGADESVALADTAALRALQRSLRRAAEGGEAGQDAAAEVQGLGDGEDAVALADAMASIRVRLPRGRRPATLVVKLLRRDTVQSLYAAVAAHMPPGPFEIRSAFPPRRLTDMSEDLSAAGLAPAAAVIAVAPNNP